ncbi:hypothetical protein I79_001247 [Cricetulus griseus]|uniref:Uncharacterized protein n=1 Tax=Cricetulus griseus TaxID=10029 RepID=G3GU93_CRIGR|nr:hypothetical protein I79_001247 [Cricetulus griseus]
MCKSSLQVWSSKSPENFSKHPIFPSRGRCKNNTRPSNGSLKSNLTKMATHHSIPTSGIKRSQCYFSTV